MIALLEFGIFVISAVPGDLRLSYPQIQTRWSIPKANCACSIQQTSDKTFNPARPWQRPSLGSGGFWLQFSRFVAVHNPTEILLLVCRIEQVLF
jgi:hypothetical protein